MPVCTASSGDVVAEASVVAMEDHDNSKGKLSSSIATGICFLDHMVDQFTSHGMVGVTLRCGIKGNGNEPPSFFLPHTDYAMGMKGRPHDRDIFFACGSALGLALSSVVETAVEAVGAKNRGRAVFCSPLDESFSEVVLDVQPQQEQKGKCAISLEPYGTFARGNAGRQWVGRYRTELTPVFWSSLATSMKCDVSLRKVRGGNAHHILEASFKSFARALRAALDNIVDGGSHGCADPTAGPLVPVAPCAEPRKASRQRTTKETSIEISVNLDSPWHFEDPSPGARAARTGKWAPASQLKATFQSSSCIQTGISVLDNVLVEFAKAAGIEVVVRCEGDRYIDDHHTAEDVAITLGQCFHEALGDKAGCARMGCAEGEQGSARVRTVLDLSNRPHFESDLPFDDEFVGAVDGADPPAKRARLNGHATDENGAPAPCDEFCGAALSSEMLYHVFNSLTLEMRSTCHLELIKDSQAPGHTLDLALAAAKAYGSALSRAVRVDPRRGGAVASSKGTLSK